MAGRVDVLLHGPNAAVAQPGRVQTAAAVPAAVASVPDTARFYGDPGVGNFYLGMSTPSRSTVATHEAEMSAPLAVLRHSSPSGVPNYTTIDSIIAGGRIPWTSWKATGTQTVARIAAGLEDTWIDAIGAQFAARAPAMIIWTFWHEPENDAAVSGANAPDYRAAQRRMAQRIKALAPNAVFAATLFQFPWSFGTSSGRDWRIWYPDWKGTTAAGSTKFAPDPSDFYVDGDPNSVVELFGIDWYHEFEIQDNPADAITKWTNYTAPSMWTQRLQPMTEFLGKPYAVGEWSTSAAQDGLSFSGATMTLTQYASQVTAGTITFYPTLTNTWIDDYFAQKDYGAGFVVFCYWDDSSTKSTTQVATNPLGVCDPAKTRWARIGLHGQSSSAKTWTG